MQRRLDDLDRIQREVYPSIKGQSRWRAFPGLQQNERAYSKTWEKRSWSLQPVLDHMANEHGLRRVDRKGQVSIYGRSHYVGKAHQGQDVYVFLDPVDREWVFATPAGVQLRRKTAEEITQGRILKLQVTNRRGAES